MPTSPSLGVSVSPQWNELLEVSAETPQQSLETSDHIIMGHICTELDDAADLLQGLCELRIVNVAVVVLVVVPQNAVY